MIIGRIAKRNERYIYYKLAVWLYLFLLIFEGALRKWIFPSLATPLLLVREPIVIWLFCVGIQHRWIQNVFARCLMIFGVIAFVTALLFAHHNLYVALYGLRIYLFHFSFIIVAVKILNREDVLRMCKCILYLSIPMTILIMIQFYSPQSAWVNRGIGGDMEGAGFGGALGYFRPPGTFSFTLGYVAFQGLVCSILLYFLLKNSELRYEQRINRWMLYVMIICYILSVPYSISRTLMFTTVISLAFLFIAILLDKSNRVHFIVSICAILLLLWGATSLGLFGESVDVFMERFTTANEVEGGLAKGVIGERLLGGIVDSLVDFDIPILGYGLGIGTNAGAKLVSANMYTYFNAENGYGMIIGECGLLLGWLIVGCRVAWGVNILRRSLIYIRRYNDLLPWCLCSFAFVEIVNGQIGTPMSLGFIVMSMILTMSALKRI